MSRQSSARAAKRLCERQGHVAKHYTQGRWLCARCGVELPVPVVSGDTPKQAGNE